METSPIDALCDALSIVKCVGGLWHIHVNHTSDPAAPYSLAEIAESLLAIGDIANGLKTAVIVAEGSGAFSGASSGVPLEPTSIYGHVGRSVTRMASDGWRHV